MCKLVIGYLDDYHKNKGYMLSFCFNKKQTGIQEIVIDGKTVIEAVVSINPCGVSDVLTADAYGIPYLYII